MTRQRTTDPLLSAAILKVSMARKGLVDSPGFRVVYMGTLEELGVTDDAVNAFVSENLDAIDAHIRSHGKQC